MSMADQNAITQPASAAAASPGSLPSRRPIGRHQVKRSLSELTSPVKLRNSNRNSNSNSSGGGHHSRNSSHGHHHHHHHTHHSHHHSRHRRYDSREVQSAQPTTYRASLEAPRPEALPDNNNNNNNGNNNNNNNNSNYDKSNSNYGRTAMADDAVFSRFSFQQPLVAASKGDILRREQERANRRVEDLKQALVQLHAYSTGTTRRLDETYYAVLEKTAAVQMTFSALKDLAGSSGDAARDFDKDAQDLEEDIRGQLRALDSFESQEGRIRSLQERISAGRSRMLSLVGRVDEIGDMVERWERADREWQIKMRRRLRAIWGLVLVVVLALTALVMSANNDGGTDDSGNNLSPSSAAAAASDAADLPSHQLLRHEPLNITRLVPTLDKDAPPGQSSTDGQGSLFRSKPQATDDRLRQFDEL